MSTAAGGVVLVAEGDLKRKKASYTPAIIFLFFGLLGLGLVNLYSATPTSAVFYNQLKHAGFGVVVFFVLGFFIQPQFVMRHAYLFFALTCLLLVSVFFAGDSGGGAKRWIYLGPIGGQPSELAKLVIIIVVARFFYDSKISRPYILRELWPILLMVIGVFALIFPQPDFGTAGFCLMLAAAQFAFIRLNWRSIGSVVGILVAGAPLVWQFLLHDYQRTRVLSFLNPSLDPQGSGYNAMQSLVAIGSGGLTGKGFLQGTQTHLQFIPERHTDFIFSVFAEEHGFWGGAIVFLLFAGLAYVALEVGRQSKDAFCSLLAAGIAALFIIQFTVNVAMVLRLFPVVGIPLPFFSQGGSSLLIVCAAMGLLLSIDRESRGLAKGGQSLSREPT